MSTWAKSTLSQECSIAIGGTPARNRADYWDSDKRTSNHWVAISDLHGRYITSTAERISDEGVRNSSAKLVEQGSVLLSFKLTLGRTAIAGVELYTNEAIAALRSDSLDHLFLHYGLQSWNLLGDVDQAIKGATLNKAKLKRIPISFPKDKKVQEGIALVLDTVDRAIEQTEALLAKQQRIKMGLMHDLLTRGLDSQGHLRDPATHSFKESALGPIPVEWEVKTLANVVPVERPIVYGILMPGDYFEGGVPVIKVKDVQGGAILTDGLLKTHPKIDEAYSRSRLREGDLLFTIRGSVGRMAVVPKELDGANITQDSARITVAHGNTTFIRHCLQMPAQRAFIELHTIGQAVKGINLGEVRKILVQFPHPDEQGEIARKLDKHDCDTRMVSDHLAKLRRLKAGLMNDLLTGAVPVAPLPPNP